MIGGTEEENPKPEIPTGKQLASPSRFKLRASAYLRISCFGFRIFHSYRNACTGCSDAARRAGRMLASTAISIAPSDTQITITGFT